MDVLVIVAGLAVVGGLLGMLVALLAGADGWQLLGRAIAGMSGSTVAGLAIWLTTASMFATVLAALLFGYLAIVVTSGSLD